MIDDKPLFQNNLEDERHQLSSQERESLYRNFSYHENRDHLTQSMSGDEVKFWELQPNSIYNKNGYEYRTNEEGNVEFVYGKLELKDGGTTFHQTEVGKLGLATDEGGHLIGKRFNGPPDGFNLVPQDVSLNRGGWKAMENEWASELKSGHEVTVAIEPYYDGDDSRPQAFDVVWQKDNELPQYRAFINKSNMEKEK